MPVRGPGTAILSLRKPSLVFALRASRSAVQIRSRRICASPKESIQRKGDPDAAFILRSEGFAEGFRKGLPAPPKTSGMPEKRGRLSLPLPCGLISAKPPVLGAA